MTESTVVVALAITGIVFITKKIIFKNFKRSSAMATEVKLTMIKQNLDFDKARENVIARKIAKAMKIDNETLKITDSQIVKQGDRISFNTEKYGFVTGEFIGTKKAQAEGYTETLIIKFKDGKILQAPLEYISKDTIMIYER